MTKYKNFIRVNLIKKSNDKWSSFEDLSEKDKYVSMHHNNLLALATEMFKIDIKKLYGPFIWIWFNCLKATEPRRGNSLLFAIQFPEIPGTHLIDLERIKRY